MRGRGCLINWVRSGLPISCSETEPKVGRESQLEEDQDPESGDSVVILTMLTMLVMVLMVLTDELHGWPELFTGVVGWCSVKSAATPVWCAACSMWGSSGRPLGSVGVPGVAHQFVRRSSARLGSSARRLRHTSQPSAQFCYDNHEGTDGHAGSMVRVLDNSIGSPTHQNGPFLCVFPCRKTLVSSTAHKYENSRKMRCWPFSYCSARTCEVRLNITSSAA